MRRIIGPLALALVIAGCSGADSLTEPEANWCRLQSGFRMLEQAAGMGIDLTGVYAEAERIADVQGTVEERQDARETAFRRLEDDADYVEVCRTLYDDTGRPFDPVGD
jgi:hypothetical protein